MENFSTDQIEGKGSNDLSQIWNDDYQQVRQMVYFGHELVENKFILKMQVLSVVFSIVHDINLDGSLNEIF